MSKVVVADSTCLIGLARIGAHLDTRTRFSGAHFGVRRQSGAATALLTGLARAKAASRCACHRSPYGFSQISTMQVSSCAPGLAACKILQQIFWFLEENES